MTLGEVADLNGLQHGTTDAWRSFDIARVNGNRVRFHVMEDSTANRHVHATSDELFYVVSGTLFMDTEFGTRDACRGRYADFSDKSHIVKCAPIHESLLNSCRNLRPSSFDSCASAVPSAICHLPVIRRSSGVERASRIRMTAMKNPRIAQLLQAEPRVINIGLAVFAGDLRAAGIPVVQLDWSPPGSGDPKVVALLAKLSS